jgi:hypothetical protein
LEANGEDENSILVAEFTTRLLARLYPALSIGPPSDRARSLIELAKSINPRVDITEQSEATVTLVTGDTGSAPIAEGAIYARADGWVARVTAAPPAISVGPPNPFAAGAAAAIAVSELFRRVFAIPLGVEPTSRRDVHLSLLDFSSDGGAELHLGPLDLGRVAMIGLGAVGNSAIWALAKCRALSGDMWLVDSENIELSNLQRYALALDRDVGRAKTLVALDALGGTHLRLVEVRDTLEVFAGRRPEALAMPTMCVSVDNVDSRRHAQALLPRMLLNGWTSDTGLGSSWHRFDNGQACLSCLYQPTGVVKSQTEMVADALGLPHQRALVLWVAGLPPSEPELEDIAKHLGVPPKTLSHWKGAPLSKLYTEVVCGAIPMDLKGVGRLEVVPLAHQSALAGVLMAAELVKRSSVPQAARAQNQTLVTWEDVRRSPPSQWCQPRAQAPNCICQDSVYQEVYRQKWTPDHHVSS